MSSDILGRTGAELEAHMREIEPDFSVSVLLDEYFGLDEIHAAPITEQTRAAEVKTIDYVGPFALAALDSGIVQSQEKTSIIDAYFGRRDTIAVHDSMIETITTALGEGKLLPVAQQAAGETAQRIAGLFEMGRFIGHRVYSTIMTNFHSAGYWETTDFKIKLPIPQSERDGKSFFEHYQDELNTAATAVGRELSYGPVIYTSEAAAYYNRELRPERFATRAGLLTVEAVDEMLDVDRILSRFRADTIADHIGASIISATARNGATEPISELGAVLLPPLQDMAAMCPMPRREFSQLTSYVRNFGKEVAPIDSLS